MRHLGNLGLIAACFSVFLSASTSLNAGLKVALEDIETEILAGNILKAESLLNGFPEGSIRNAYLGLLKSYEFFPQSFNPSKAQDLFLSVGAAEDCQGQENKETFLSCYFSRSFVEIARARHVICDRAKHSSFIIYMTIKPAHSLARGLLALNEHIGLLHAAKNESWITKGLSIDSRLSRTKELLKQSNFAVYLTLKYRYAYKSITDKPTQISKFTKGSPIGKCLIRTATHHQNPPKEPAGSPKMEFAVFDDIAHFFVYRIFVGSEFPAPKDGNFKKFISAVSEELRLNHTLPTSKNQLIEWYCALALPFASGAAVRKSSVFKKCIHHHSG